MISFLPQQPYSNPAGRSYRQGNIWRESASLHACSGEGCRTPPPALMIHWDPSHFFSLKTVTEAERNHQSWSLDMGPPSPQIAGFSDWGIFPFYWHLPLKWLLFEWWAGEPELSNKCCVGRCRTFRVRCGICRWMFPVAAMFTLAQLRTGAWVMSEVLVRKWDQSRRLFAEVDIGGKKV